MTKTVVLLLVKTSLSGINQSWLVCLFYWSKTLFSLFGWSTFLASLKPVWNSWKSMTVAGIRTIPRGTVFQLKTAGKGFYQETSTVANIHTGRHWKGWSQWNTTLDYHCNMYLFTQFSEGICFVYYSWSALHSPVKKTSDKNNGNNTDTSYNKCFLIINNLLCNCRKTSWFGNIYKFDKSLSFLGTCSKEKKDSQTFISWQ